MKKKGRLMDKNKHDIFVKLEHAIAEVIEKVENPDSYMIMVKGSTGIFDGALASTKDVARMLVSAGHNKKHISAGIIKAADNLKAIEDEDEDMDCDTCDEAGNCPAESLKRMLKDMRK